MKTKVCIWLAVRSKKDALVKGRKNMFLEKSHQSLIALTVNG